MEEEEALLWTQIPSYEDDPLWLNGEPVAIEIPIDDLRDIRASTVYSMRMIDMLNISSVFGRNIFQNLKQFFVDTVSFAPFTLSPSKFWRRC